MSLNLPFILVLYKLNTGSSPMKGWEQAPLKELNHIAHPSNRQLSYRRKYISKYEAKQFDPVEKKLSMAEKTVWRL